jgi:hypothetical protein
MVRAHRSLAIPKAIHFIIDEGYAAAFVATERSGLNGAIHIFLLFYDRWRRRSLGIPSRRQDSPVA